MCPKQILHQMKTLITARLVIRSSPSKEVIPMSMDTLNYLWDTNPIPRLAQNAQRKLTSNTTLIRIIKMKKKSKHWTTEYAI